MAASKAKSLRSIFRSAAKSRASSITTRLTSPADDTTLKLFVSSLDPSKAKSESKRPPSIVTASPLTLPSLKLDATSDSDDSTNELPGTILSILRTSGDTSASSPDLQGTEDWTNTLEKVLDLPWFPDVSNSTFSSRRKEVTRERKQKWVFKSTQVDRFDRLVNMCATHIGTETTIRVFDKLGRESGVKEYNAVIKICIERAKRSVDEEEGLEHFYKAFQIFKSMKEQGFQLEEETYGQFLVYLIDIGMVEEFHFFCGIIKAENPSLVSKLGYYEMLLWIRVNNEEKIQELCNYIVSGDGGNKSILQENYLLALCESDRKKEILQLLNIVDITKFSSMDYVACIFRCLGRLLLEAFAEKFLLTFKACDCAAEDITNFIYSYVAGIPNLAVEDVISKFKNLHKKLEVKLSSASYAKLIMHCCDSLKVHVALEIVDEMCKLGLTLPMEALHSILHASDESCDFNLVRQIYSVICRHKLNPNKETFRIMISLCVKMKDYEGAYSMLSDLEKMNVNPTTSMYNAIMAGYFRERNIYGGLRVLRQMKEADVKPDSHTFSYLISQCDSEEDINKYYEELKCSGTQVTKQVFMALINGYATCGQFEKAKQVLLDKRIPTKNLNEIKSVLVQALASHGQFLDAFNIYEKMKQAECSLEPKAVISLIEHLQSDEELSRVLPLLEEIDDPDYWVDGCLRTISHCLRYKHLRPAVNLLKQLRDKLCTDELALEVIFDQVFCLVAELDSTYLQLGLDLLHAIKNELGLTPSRKCLDFLLHACVNAKDLQSSLLIWKEYEAAGLPYNTLSYLRMYQALLAAGDHQAARRLLSEIPTDDLHVRYIIQACKMTYSEEKKKKKKKKKK